MKVLIVDDHIIFREGLASLLKADKYFNVVGQAGSVHEAVDLARKLYPDLILMDFCLPDGDGAEAAATILKEQPGCKIVFLTMFDADDKLFTAIRSGAQGYLLKNVPVANLVNSLKSIENGEAAISGAMTMRILQEFSQQHPRIQMSEPGGKDGVLSHREIEILQEIAVGATNDEIANKLFLSVNTVKHHIHNILNKLRLENRREAIHYARRAGLIKPI